MPRRVTSTPIRQFDLGTIETKLSEGTHMKVLVALILGLVVGAGVVWFFASDDPNSRLRSAGGQLESATKPALDAVQAKLQQWNLDPQHVKEELARSGQVVRKKAIETGQAIADATADARITATIKGKFVADRNLSALSISVNTTSGVVTLSGAVPSAEHVGRAVLLVMEVDGVREVISTLQVKPSKEKS
jgi:hyperosmotically inducible periplasmic protein